MLVEIILTSMCIACPGGKENVVEACNTQDFGGAGLPLTLQGGSVPGDEWQCTHTKYVPIFGGGKQRFGDNWDFFS